MKSIFKGAALLLSLALAFVGLIALMKYAPVVTGTIFGILVFIALSGVLGAIFFKEDL